MKRIVYFIAVVLACVFAASMNPSCNRNSSWKKTNEKVLRESLSDYRIMPYLRDLDDNEYETFMTELISDFEKTYSSYDEFINLPNVIDTVDMKICNKIIGEIKEDSYNFRHLYSYEFFTAIVATPQYIEEDSIKAFYSCLIYKLNLTYDNIDEFYMDLLNDSIQNVDLLKFIDLSHECSDELFEDDYHWNLF